MLLTSLGDPNITLFKYCLVLFTHGFQCLTFATGYTYLYTLIEEMQSEGVNVAVEYSHMKSETDLCNQN